MTAYEASVEPRRARGSRRRDTTRRRRRSPGRRRAGSACAPPERRARASRPGGGSCTGSTSPRASCALLDHLARRLKEGPRASDPEPSAPARPAPPAPNPADAFEDVRDEPGGFSLPALKWRELLFTGVLVERDGAFERDPARPAPPFRRGELFPPGARFRAERLDARMRVTRLD